MNPYHKPAGHYTPIVDPKPVHELSPFERFKLMIDRMDQETADKLFPEKRNIPFLR